LSKANKNIVVCNLKWARVGKGIIANDDEGYFIESINYETNTITLTDNYESPLGVAYLELPTYKYGTPKATNTEWQPNELGVTPCIWLVEPVDEQPFGRDSSVERESDLRLIFLDSRDSVNWLNKDIHEQRSRSLYALQEEFVKTIERNLIFKRFTNYSLRNLTKLGTESAQGFEKNIINSDLTALDLRLTLPIYKGLKCNC
jgi:hypothetical protein